MILVEFLKSASPLGILDLKILKARITDIAVFDDQLSNIEAYIKDKKSSLKIYGKLYLHEIFYYHRKLNLILLENHNLLDFYD